MVLCFIFQFFVQDIHICFHQLIYQSNLDKNIWFNPFPWLQIDAKYMCLLYNTQINQTWSTKASWLNIWQTHKDLTQSLLLYFIVLKKISDFTLISNQFSQSNISWQTFFISFDISFIVFDRSPIFTRCDILFATSILFSTAPDVRIAA